MCKWDDLDRWNTLNLLSKEDAKILREVIENEEDGGISLEDDPDVLEQINSQLNSKICR